MHAIRHDRLGPPEVLRLVDLPDLVPAQGQVRIAVRTCGVHLLDTSIRSGAGFGPLGAPELPMTPGREVAGVVDAVGEGVPESWLLGRRVVAHLGAASGGYASQALAAVTSLHEVPDALGFDTAVAAIGTGRTAVGILDQVSIAPDDVVLVMSAAGGLGSLLVQAAVAAGATVVGLAGGAKLGHVKDLGAHLAIDYRAEGWAAEVRAGLGGVEPTLLFDGYGGDATRIAFDLLAPHGRLMTYGAPFAVRHPTKQVLTLLGPQMTARPGGLRSLEEEALRRAADGSRVPLVGSVFALADAAEAHRALEARATYGKVVLHP